MIFKMSKRKIFVLLLVLITTFLSADRSNDKGYKIDFIQSIEQLSTGEDKIEALIKLAKFYLLKHKDYEKSIEFLLKAQDLNITSLKDSDNNKKQTEISSIVSSQYVKNKIMISILLSKNSIDFS